MKRRRTRRARKDKGREMRKITRRSATASASESVRQGVKRHHKKARVDFIDSGCTTLNLALSGKGKDGGWPRGRISNIVGDGSSGKTLLALELAFSAFKNILKIKSQIFGKPKKLDIYYDNIEGVLDFPIEDMYGEEFVEAVHWERSKHFEAMSRKFIKKALSLKKREAMIYIIDSWDSFQSAKSKAAFLEAVKTDKELKGDYDLIVQKYASRKFFPAFCDIMNENKIDATLIIISQVRSKIGITYGKKQYRAGGKSLDFYTHVVPWIAQVEKLKKKKKGREKVYGIRSAVTVERSKVAKPFREAEFIILYDYGFDDINSMIDYLWGKKDIKFKGEEFKRKELIRYIEEEDLEDELRAETERVWQDIEGAFEDEVKKRKRRY